MPTFRFTKYAAKKLRKLDTIIQKRILGKLEELKDRDDVHAIVAPLQDVYPATHRLRMGDYRLVLKQDGEGKFIVVDVGHRSSIYR